MDFGACLLSKASDNVHALILIVIVPCKRMAEW